MQAASKSLKFPWSRSGSANSDDLTCDTLEAVSIYNQYQRALEEKVIILKERNALLKFLGTTDSLSTLNDAFDFSLPWHDHKYLERWEWSFRSVGIFDNYDWLIITYSFCSTSWPSVMGREVHEDVVRCLLWLYGEWTSHWRLWWATWSGTTRWWR